MIYITVDRSFKRRLAIFAGLCAVFVLARYAPPSFGLKAAATTLKPVTRVNTTAKQLALTFDLTWGEEVPAQVLGILKSQDVKATFFVSGPWVAANPALCRRVLDEGHELATLGYQYINLHNLGKEALVENIDRSLEAIERVTQQKPTAFRPPNGRYSDLVITTAMERGLSTILWDVNAQIGKNERVDEAIKRLVSRAHPGAIYRFQANDTVQVITRVLPQFLTALREKGYQVVTVSQLIRQASD